MTAPAGLMPARRVAELIGVTGRTLANWRSEGLLIPTVIQGRNYYLESDVAALVDNGHRRCRRRHQSRQTDGRFK